MRTHLDGNALAGGLTDLLAFEGTAAETKCRACGDVAALGQALLYGRPMGSVLRCRRCDNVLIVIVERPGRTTSFSMRGLVWMRPPMPS